MILTLQNGLLGVWSSQLNYQHSKNLLDGWSGGRVKVTDCLTMGNCNKLVLSLSSRELSFFDTVDSFKCKYKLHGMCYYYLGEWYIIINDLITL